MRSEGQKVDLRGGKCRGNSPSHFENLGAGFFSHLVERATASPRFSVTRCLYIHYGTVDSCLTSITSGTLILFLLIAFYTFNFYRSLEFCMVKLSQNGTDRSECRARWGSIISNIYCQHSNVWVLPAGEHGNNSLSCRIGDSARLVNKSWSHWRSGLIWLLSINNKENYFFRRI